MKALVKVFVVLFLGGALLGSAKQAQASAPYLSVSNQNGTNIVLTISNADAFGQITLYRRQGGSLWTVISNLANTDSTGYYSQQMNLGGDGTNNPVDQYVVVNGQQSNTVTTYPNNGGCSYNCGNPGYLSLSQNTVTLNAGQSITINTYSSGGGVYLSTNPQSNIATASVNGNQITVYGISSGSTSFSVCTNNYYQCASVNVTVNNNYCYSSYCGNNNGISFSQSNISLNQNQSLTVYIYNNSGSGYYISSNSGNNVASGYISGNVLTLNGISAGSTVMTICSNNSVCGSINITVNGNNCYGQYCGWVQGATAYSNGQLVSINKTVYISYKNTLIPFGSAGAFTGLGYSFWQVTNGGSYNNQPVSSYVISNSHAAHPWGAWVKSGSTIYFVHDLGLIPIPDWNTFVNNGGQSNLIVPANSWDFQLPILSVMGYGDTRLK